MKITKQAGTESGLPISPQDLDLINQWSRKTLTPEEIYSFSVRLCDNQIDRDGERFPIRTLEQLAPLFVGKTGIFDHQWSARNQAARIFRTELVREESTPTASGEPYCYLKAYAYMLRTSENQALITEIEGGIKKEVSVGCAINRRVCSVCGGTPGECGHVPGAAYEGTVCCAELLDASDAYEWSFVAVPAQKNAGVIKSFLSGGEELEQLRAEAAMGRRYLASLRQEVTRLGGLAGNGPDIDVLRSVTNKLDESELLALKHAYETKLHKLYPAQPQLNYSHPEPVRQNDDVFQI